MEIHKCHKIYVLCDFCKDWLDLDMDSYGDKDSIFMYLVDMVCI